MARKKKKLYEVMEEFQGWRKYEVKAGSEEEAEDLVSKRDPSVKEVDGGEDNFSCEAEEVEGGDGE